MIAGLVNHSPWWINWIGGAALTLGVIIFLYATLFMKKESGKKEETVMGDNFTNNGNNFGHMGNVTNNFGKQPFALIDDHVSEILRRAPASKPVIIESVGSKQSQLQTVNSLAAL